MKKVLVLITVFFLSYFLFFYPKRVINDSLVSYNKPEPRDFSSGDTVIGKYVVPKTTIQRDTIEFDSKFYSRSSLYFYTCTNNGCAYYNLCVLRTSEIDDNTFVRVKLGQKIDHYNTQCYEISEFKNIEPHFLDQKDLENQCIKVVEESSEIKGVNFKYRSTADYTTNANTLLIDTITEQPVLSVFKELGAWSTLTINCVVDNRGNVNRVFYNIYDSSFTSNTLVLSPDGPKQISNLKVGDVLISLDTNTNEKITTNVLFVGTRYVDKLIIINDSIETTGAHEFAVIIDDKLTWKRAEDIKVGDSLISQEGDVLIVKSVELKDLDSFVQVYNPDVTYPDNYYVLLDNVPVLVHNKY